MMGASPCPAIRVLEKRGVGWEERCVCVCVCAGWGWPEEAKLRDLRMPNSLEATQQERLLTQPGGRED